MQNNLYIFPSSRAVREYQVNSINIDQLLEKSITIGEFFQRVILSNDKIRIDSDLRILYLQEAIGSLNIKTLGLSKNFSKFYTQSEYIFKFFNELNSEYKTIDDLKQGDTYALYWDHLDILKEVYIQYIKILKKNNYVDNITLPLEYQINDSYILQYKNITLFYEGYFSLFEFEVLKQISQKINLNITVNINEFNKKNIELFSKINLELDVNHEYLLDISNKKVINKKKIKTIDINHTIYPIDQRITQIGFIKYAITKMINNGIEASKIMILLPDEKFDTYLKLFNKSNKYGNEKYFNFAMGNDIKYTLTLKKAKAIQGYIQNNEPKDKFKIEFFNIDINYIDKSIKKNWNKSVSKNLLFELIDYVSSDEQNEDILSNIVAIKLSLENLFFRNKSNSDFDKLTFKDAYQIVLNKFNEIILDDVKGGIVTVLGILETRNIQYDGVIVIDFNDDKIPKRSVKDKFISTNVKKFASLPTLEDRQDLQKYYYKKLFESSKNLMISYVDDEQNSISRFAKELFKNINIKTVDFSSILQDDKEYKFLEQNYELDIDLSRLSWSATSLKVYLQCKRKYYFNYIKNIKEHNVSLKPAGYEIGQILHNILEKVYKNNNFSYQNICNEIKTYQGNNPYLTLNLELWKKKINAFCINEIKRANNTIRMHKVEEPFNIIYNNINIKGTIDRIDKLKNDKYEILDYKTSNSLKIDTLKTYENSIDFQLEFYYLATRDIQVEKVGYYDLNTGEIKSEIMLDEKIKRLDEILLSLKTKSVNFKKCEDVKECLYCIYKTLCDRE